MNTFDNKKRIELKYQSFHKWSAIVNDLMHEGKGSFSLFCDDCGYCQVYLTNDEEFGWTTGEDCKVCPLHQKKVCMSGDAWMKVYDWYVAKHDPEWYTKERRVDTLIEAERILEAIEEDLAFEHK